jgi:hypothetical protein
MIEQAMRVGPSRAVSGRRDHIKKSAGLLVCALALLPTGALADCTDSNFCTRYGTGALVSNTTGIVNTAIGYGALFSNTTGYANTASGRDALYTNTTGGFNTASGVQALFFNDGWANTASGYQALHKNTTGSENTASGFGALLYNTTGSYNTASGYRALFNNTTGNENTASGRDALNFNTSGDANTASGALALRNNATGSYNTASGKEALYYNTTGVGNVAIGYRALYVNATGNDNIAIGNNAGSLPQTGVNNIHIGHAGGIGETRVIRLGHQGTQLKTFIAGIRGSTVSGATVVVNSFGRLGVVSSSRNYKESIQPMADASAALMKLQPVTFRYKEADERGEKPLQFGLIAEEVAAVIPELVVRNEQGHPETVAYHVLPSLLLNEYQKQQVKLAQLTRETAQLRKALAARDKELADISAQADQDHAKVVAMSADMQALRQVTQQLMAAIPNATTVGVTAP